MRSTCPNWAVMSALHDMKTLKYPVANRSRLALDILPQYIYVKLVCCPCDLVRLFDTVHVRSH